MQAQSITQSERSAGRLFAAVGGVLFLTVAVLHALAGYRGTGATSRPRLS